jgi:hypothetical protein
LGSRGVDVQNARVGILRPEKGRMQQPARSIVVGEAAAPGQQAAILDTLHARTNQRFDSGSR